MYKITQFIILLFILFSCNSDENTSQVVGVDVSHYQDDIDWRAVRNTQISFAIVKATEGTDWHDTYFDYNWKLIRKAGLVRGAYHFFNFYSSPVEQFKNYSKYVRLQSGDLPPILDVEQASKLPDKQKIRENVRIWLRLAEKKYKVKPIIYTGKSFYNDNLSGYFPGYPLWIAAYSNNVPVLSDGFMWHIWQYTDKGRVNGIDHPVDLNYFAGDMSFLRKICIP